MATSDISTDAFGLKISYPAYEIYCLTVKANGDVAAGQDRIFFFFFFKQDRIFKTVKNLPARGDVGLTVVGRGININNLSSSPQWSTSAEIPFNKQL